jgi:hypothetical protein
MITTAHSRAYDLPSVPALIAYLHATAEYPVKSTWLVVVKQGAYKSGPGLTPELISRYCYCPDLVETHKGYMAQPQQHIRSTSQPTQVSMHSSQSTIEIHEILNLHMYIRIYIYLIFYQGASFEYGVYSNLAATELFTVLQK